MAGQRVTLDAHQSGQRAEKTAEDVHTILELAQFRGRRQLADVAVGDGGPGQRGLKPD